MCQKITNTFRCLHCKAIVPGSTAQQITFGWITCPEYTDRKLSDPEDCSVAAWKPLYATETDLDEPHKECKERWNRHPRETREREQDGGVRGARDGRDGREGRERREDRRDRERPRSYREEAASEERKKAFQKYVARKGSRDWEPTCSQ
jgi:hypothetical protein